MFITKPKIFISSTITDLPSERTKALNAVDKVGGIPIMSEMTMEGKLTKRLMTIEDIVRLIPTEQPQKRGSYKPRKNILKAA